MNTDGGPAFPMAEGDWSGMSLRDWFAGKALAGMTVDWSNHSMTADDCATASFCIADAMLRARERGQEGANDAEDDEAWLARQPKGCIHTARDGMSWASCEAGEQIVAAGGFSRAAAIRALRAKVEGGAQ